MHKLNIMKIALIGDQKVGKTALVNQLVNHSFSINNISYIADYRPYKYSLQLQEGENQSQNILLLIQDLPGLDSLLLDDPSVKDLVNKIFDNQ